MSRLARSATATITFTFEGRQIKAQSGDSVAAALLAEGIRDLRATPVSGAPRGPLCMMGICFDCLVEIDGMGNQQACMHNVREGMRVSRQIGAYDAAAGFSPEPNGDEAAP